jgi:arylsulfatase A-like enzyme
LGSTPEEVTGSLQAYGLQNASFGLVEETYHGEIDNGCDQRCRTLRQYTNIRHAEAKAPLHLVEHLEPAQGARPDIFIIVIDSLRPDYLGAYNPAVDFTPNLDALARDSVVMRNAFTQYAGTSLSEPAIWSGALLLHAHYMQPFDRVNSLRTLARTDGYQIVLTYDHILRKLFSPEDDLIKLDAEKSFAEMEISSTLEQLENVLQDPHRPHDRPVLFYTQPMNIHELGVNHLPGRTAANWRMRPGFSNRIAFKLHQVDDFLGEFFRYLKARGLYDNSIIIITADHGDALADLPGFGMVRRNHSTILFPEVMRVPLIIHLPRAMREHLVWDENRVATLTDIAPSLYYLLGHRPIQPNPIFGRPIFAASEQELHAYDRDHLLLASDARAAYGILSGDGRFMYTAYDSPRRSFLFDLASDPKGVHNVVTGKLQAQFDRQILEDLQSVATFYDFRPDGASSAEFAWDDK